jgi:hypothetical protein
VARVRSRVGDLQVSVDQHDCRRPAIWRKTQPDVDPGIQISEMPPAPNTHPLTNLSNACGPTRKEPREKHCRHQCRSLTVHTMKVGTDFFDVCKQSVTCEFKARD